MTSFSNILRTSALLAAIFAACVLLTARAAHASTTFTVDRTDDPDPATAKACTEAPSDCSLRGAIVAANAVAGEDDITVPAGTRWSRRITPSGAPKVGGFTALTSTPAPRSSCQNERGTSMQPNQSWSTRTLTPSTAFAASVSANLWPVVSFWKM
jgi:hypothetical protein